MKHPRPRLVTVASSYARSRSVRKNARLKPVHAPTPTPHPGGQLESSYRALLEASTSAILLLSPGSIILGWNRAAETISGWRAHEVLGGRYVDRCVPIEARAAFRATLARVTEGSEVKGCEFPLVGRTGVQTQLSWNMTRVVGLSGELLGLMAIGTTVVSATEQEDVRRRVPARIPHEAHQVQSAVEEERRRIARELHDEFGQALTGLKFDLAWCGMKLTQSPAPADRGDLLNKIQTMSGSIAALLESVRLTAAALRPAMLDDLGLVPALECLATTFQDRTGAGCTIDVAQELSSITLPSETSTGLFRIAQELLTNVMRHAAASQVHMRLYRDGGRVTLEVTDNGKGITRERMTRPHSFGLRGMRERIFLLGGHFHIVGTSGVGTRACASVPIAEYLVP